MNSTGRLSVRQRSYFNHRLSLFLRSGVPIVTALTYIAADADSRQARTMFTAIMESVASGTTLASALLKYSRAFAPLEVSLVRTGEASGRLHESLAHAAALIERERILRARMIGALLYPCLILAAAFMIVLFLVLYAFPKILPLFRGFDGALPFSTRALIAISDGATHYGVFILVACVLAGLLLVWLDRRPTVRLRRHYLLIRLPLIGSMLRAYQLALITKVLGTLVKSGVGLVPALELAIAVAGNSAYQEALRLAHHEVVRGRPMSNTLSALPVLFPSLATQIVRTGEMMGNLGESLLQVADIYDEEVQARSQHLAVLVEPILMIGTGAIVGFIALSIITPIYRITQDLSL